MCLNFPTAALHGGSRRSYDPDARMVRIPLNWLDKQLYGKKLPLFNVILAL